MDIVGRAVREGNLLTISFELLGDLTQTVLSERSPSDPKTSVPFWRTTHLKCFLSPAGTARYWKFQLLPDYDWVECFSVSPSAWDFQISPNHDWTVVRYDGYRLNPQDEADVCIASYSLLSSPQALHTLLKIDLERLGLAEQPLQLGLAAVAKVAGDRTTHWALEYPDSGPDFHHPDSFALPI